MASIPETEELYDNRERCLIEEKFKLLKVADNVYRGKYPLEPYTAGARGTYGGEVVTQATLAAYETIEAGSSDSTMRYEVSTSAKGKSFVTKTVNVYQGDTDTLVFVLALSFAFKNSIHEREQEFKAGKSLRVPVSFQTPPNWVFKKYKRDLDTDLGRLITMEHTHGLVAHSLPKLYFKTPIQKELSKPIAERKLGIFCKIVDELPKDPKNVKKIQIADLLYLSDSMYLGLINRTLGFKISGKSGDFFRVSLDHSVFIHDIDFDPTQWLFCDYRFVRMSNSRVLCFVMYFDLKGKQIATVTQEGLVGLRDDVTRSLKL